MTPHAQAKLSQHPAYHGQGASGMGAGTRFESQLSLLDFLTPPPWADPSVPRWRRINRLLAAADSVAAGKIVYTRTGYGQSLAVANAARDTFVQQHIDEAVWCDWPGGIPRFEGVGA